MVASFINRFSGRRFVGAIAPVALSGLLVAACVDEDDTPVDEGTAGQAGAAGSAGSSGGQAGTGGGAGAAGKGGSAGNGGSAGKGGAGTGGASGKGGAAGTGGAGAGGAGKGGAGGAGAGGAGAGGLGGAGAGAGGVGGAGAGGVGGAGAGGAGAGGLGGAGAGGVGGAGAGGATQLPCLDAAAYDSIVTLDAALPFCVTRVHAAAGSLVSSASASWGSHGGPMTSGAKGTTVDVARWTLPADPKAAITKTTTSITPPGLPAGDIFWGGVLDLPIQGWTVMSYTTTATAFAGEVIVYDHALTSLLDRGNVNGYFAGAAVKSGSAERLVYTGLSPIAATPIATNQSALWGADPCNGKLVPTGACAAAAPLATWQTSSGSVVSDGAQVLFAGMSTFGGDQEIRGFTYEGLVGAATVTGETVLLDKSFTTSLAAIAPTATDDGWLFVEESDPADFSPKPVIAARYSVSGGAVKKGATTGTLVTPKKAGATLALFSGEGGTLWIATDTSATDGVFLALRRK